VRDGGAYGCAVPRAYANLNPGLVYIILVENSRDFTSGTRTDSVAKVQ